MPVTWSTDEFMERFQNGRLGRKSQHGTLYTVELNGFDVLVAKRNRGEKPIAIKQGNFCIFSNQWQSSRGRGSDFVPRYTITFPNKLDDFEVIDRLPVPGVDKHYVLFRLNSENYILDAEVEHHMSVKEYREHSISSKYMRIYKLDEKVRDLQAAWDHIIPDECGDDSIFYKYHFLKPMGSWVPQEYKPEVLAFLEKPPMPWHYGIPMSAARTEYGFFRPAGSSMYEIERIPENIKVQREQWTKALEQYRKVADGLTENASLDLGRCEDIVLDPGRSQVRRIDDEIYLTGILCSKSGVYSYKFEEKINLEHQWWKLIKRGEMASPCSQY